MKLLLFDQNLSPRPRWTNLMICIQVPFTSRQFWIRRGNCSTHQIELILRENHMAITALGGTSIREY